MTDCQEKGLTCVVTGVPPSTTSDWLARSQTRQVRWALDQTEWSITMWTEESERESSLAEPTLLRLRLWLLVSGTLVVSRLQLLVLGPANPRTATRGQIFKGMAPETAPPCYSNTLNLCKTLQQRCRRPSRRARGLTSLAWGHIPAFWFVSPGPVSCSPALSSLPAEMPPEPGNTHAQGCKL